MTLAFLMDIFAGTVLGLGYDFLKAIRRRTTHNAILICCDMLFWLVSCSMILFVFFITSDMKLRAYEFFGLLTGIFLYFALFTRWLFPLCEKIAHFLQLFFKFLFTSLSFFGIIIKNGVLFSVKPLLWIWKWLKRLLGIPIHAWKENLKLVKRI